MWRCEGSFAEVGFGVFNFSGTQSCTLHWIQSLKQKMVRRTRSKRCSTSLFVPFTSIVELTFRLTPLHVQSSDETEGSSFTLLLLKQDPRAHPQFRSHRCCKFIKVRGIGTGAENDACAYCHKPNRVGMV